MGMALADLPEHSVLYIQVIYNNLLTLYTTVGSAYALVPDTLLVPLQVVVPSSNVQSIPPERLLPL